MNAMKEDVLFQREDDGPVVLEEEAVESQKYLIFVVDNLRIGLNAEYVVEIMNSYTVTYLPMMPDYIQGIFNMRGQIIPMLDIRARLGKMPLDQKSLLIVLNYDNTPLGILVDAVELMMDIPNELIMPIPAQSAQKLVSGMCSLPDGSGTMLVLDCDQLIQHG